MADIDDVQIREVLEDIDANKVDDNEIVENSPFKPAVLHKIKNMNDKIKNQQRLIQAIRENTKR